MPNFKDFGILAALLANPPQQERQATKPAGGPSPFLTTAVTGASAAYDLFTTLEGLKQPGVYEANPIMRAMLKKGVVPAVAATAGLTIAQGLLANELKKRGKGYWWVPQAATTGLHLLAGILNQRR